MKQGYCLLSRLFCWVCVCVFVAHVTSEWNPVNDFFENCLQVNQSLSRLSSPTNVNPKDPHNSIHIVTSVTPNILDYANFSTAINQAYAFYHGYTFTLIQEDKTVPGFFENFDEDSRWNKVKYLWQFIENNTDLGYMKEDIQVVDQYVVWLDADLILVNFNFDIGLLVADYPEAHIWMSKDKKDAPFVGNTGCIIVKVSSWAKNFLKLWWNTYDRQRCCDQNALTWLYERQLPTDIQSKLVFLPSHTLNTEFPAYLGPDRYHNMLHLAGMNTIFRVDIFSAAYRNLETQFSNHYSDNMFQQFLSVDYQFLQQRIWKLDYYRLCALQRLQTRVTWLQDQQQLQQIPNYGWSLLSEIGLLRHWLNDITKFDDDEQEIVQRFIESLSFEHNSESALRQERNELSSNLSVVFFNVHLGIRNILYTHLQAHATTFLFPCSKILTLVNHPSDYIHAINSLKQDCHKGLLLYQDVITSTFELILSRNPYPHPLEAIHMLHDELSHLLGDVLRFIPDEIKGVRSKFIYYRFKQYQLLADLYHQMISDKEDRLHHNTSLSEKEAVLQQQNSEKDTYIAHLSTASLIWKELIEKYQYYGTDYVTVDPHKEFVDLAMRLGVLRCQRGQYESGIDILDDARAKQEEMVLAYDTLRIATNSIMSQGRHTLGEIYYNMAICGYDMISRADSNVPGNRRDWIDYIMIWISKGENIVKHSDINYVHMLDAFAQVSKNIIAQTGETSVKKFRKKVKKTV